MLMFSAVLGAIGFVCMITRRSLIGMVIGFQIVLLGATLMFVFAGIRSGARVEGQIAGVLICLGAAIQLSTGYAMSIRLFSQKDEIGMDRLRSLKR